MSSKTSPAKKNKKNYVEAQSQQISQDKPYYNPFLTKLPITSPPKKLNCCKSLFQAEDQYIEGQVISPKKIQSTESIGQYQSKSSIIQQDQEKEKLQKLSITEIDLMRQSSDFIKEQNQSGLKQPRDTSPTLNSVSSEKNSQKNTLISTFPSIQKIACQYEEDQQLDLKTISIISMINRNKVEPNQKQLKLNLLDPSEYYGFNNRSKIKYQETPQFKLLLQSPVSAFIKLYKTKIVQLQPQQGQKPKLYKIQDIPFDSNPLPYERNRKNKYFICAAQKFKKQNAHAECRVMYKIAIYIQPYDQIMWEWVVKFQQELGNIRLSYDLCKTAVLFTKSEGLTEKLIRLGEKCGIALSDLRGVVYYINQSKKRQKLFQVYYELARLETVETAYKVLHYLFKLNLSTGNYTSQLAKFLYNQGYTEQCFYFVQDCIYKHSKVHAIYSIYLRLLKKVYQPLTASNVDTLFDRINFCVNRMKENLQLSSQCKINLEIYQLFDHLDSSFRRRCIVFALENSTEQYKYKPYFAIYKSVCSGPVSYKKNNQIILEINKYNFIHDKPPVLYHFSDWKYYLHYSLFYIFQRNEQAKSYIEQAATRWPQLSRIVAQLLHLDRFDGRDILQKWKNQVGKSGQVWCQGGRIYRQLRNETYAQRCFLYSIYLTPQYGDTFIQLLSLYQKQHRYADIKQLRKKIKYYQPFYGNLWHYLKSDADVGVIDIWKKAKKLIKKNLYGSSPEGLRRLTCIPQYDAIFLKRNIEEYNKDQRQRIFNIYDQTQSYK